MFFPPGTVIKQNRSWIFLAIIIFCLGGALFYFTAAPDEGPLQNLISGQVGQLTALASFIEDLPPLAAAMFLFMHNFISIVQMLFLGFLAGVSPMITLFINGGLLGTVAAISGRQGIPPGVLLLVGILPHGIFELFAFFLCGAMGLKFGYHCVASPLPGLSRWQSFRYIWKEVVSIIPLVTILLLVAALVEIYATKALLLQMLGVSG